MAILRLTQYTIDERKGKYLITARSEREGVGAFSGSAHIEFVLGAEEREDLRWYLEDYLDQPFDPAPQIAARVEGRMEEIGRALFENIFDANPRMRQVWGAIGRLHEVRVEIYTEVAAATAILPHASVRLGVVVCAAAWGLRGVAGGGFCAQL